MTKDLEQHDDNNDDDQKNLDEILRKWLFVTKVRNDKHLPVQFLEGASLILKQQSLSLSDIKTILPAQPVLGTPPRDQLFQELIIKTEKAKSKLGSTSISNPPPPPPPLTTTTTTLPPPPSPTKKEEEEIIDDIYDEKPDLPIKHPFEPFRSITPINDGTPQKAPITSGTKVALMSATKSGDEDNKQNTKIDDEEKLSNVEISFGKLIN